MSPSKVRRLIKEQKRVRRRENKALKRAQRRASGHHDEPAVTETDAVSSKEGPVDTDSTEDSLAGADSVDSRPADTIEADSGSAAEQSPVKTEPEPRIRRATLIASAAGVAVVMVAGGSVALDATQRAGSALPTTSAAWAPSPVIPASIPASGDEQQSVCPVMPGQPRSVTTDGELEYVSRDESAQATQESLVFTESEDESLIQREPRYSSEDVDDLAEVSEVSQVQAPTGHPGVGLFSYSADAGPITGLAITPCGIPQRSHWFFGPDIASTSTSILTMANPYDRPAIVEVTTVGTDGDRGLSGSRSLRIPPQGLGSVNIAALAPAGSDLGVRVQATGSPVVASLQSSRSAGSQGQGVEFLPSLGAPQSRHHIPALPVPETPDVDDEADEAEDSAAAQLWIHATGTTRTTVEVQVHAEDGQVQLDTPSVFTVEPGEIDVLSMAGLDEGTYSVDVQTSNPAYIAVHAETEVTDETGQGDAAADVVWSAPRPTVNENSGTLIPQIGESTLYFRSPGAESTVDYVLVDENGQLSDPQTVSLPAHGYAELSTEDREDAADQADLEEIVAVVFTAVDGEVYGSMVTTTDDGGTSVTGVERLQGQEQYVGVTLR